VAGRPSADCWLILTTGNRTGRISTVFAVHYLSKHGRSTVISVSLS
jgi:hypothetical protein